MSLPGYWLASSKEIVFLLNGLSQIHSTACIASLRKQLSSAYHEQLWKKAGKHKKKGKRGTQTHVTDVQKSFQHQLELLHVFQTDVVNINNNCYICFERNATSLDHIFKVFVVRNKSRLSGNLRGHIYSPWTLSQPFQARVWVLLVGRLLGLVLVGSTWKIQQNG